jgi:hypothetical protein
VHPLSLLFIDYTTVGKRAFPTLPFFMLWVRHKQAKDIASRERVPHNEIFTIVNVSQEALS